MNWFEDFGGLEWTYFVLACLGSKLLHRVHKSEQSFRPKSKIIVQDFKHHRIVFSDDVVRFLPPHPLACLGARIGLLAVVDMCH